MPSGAPSAMKGRRMSNKESWGFEEGDEIVPGRHALRSLGGGHRYQTYLAWDEEMLSLVVAKLLRPNVLGSEGALRTLAAEASALSVLNHPVLLRSFGAQLEGPRPHLVLEFLEGPPLSTLLRRQGTLALEQVIPLGVQLASALHYMHRQKMVHLDVKPRNIIMGAPPRLIDLSIARTTQEAAATKHPVGTDAYMAPEQCDPGLVGPMGPKSDSWGWGVSMYEAITGTLPFPKIDNEDESGFPQMHLEPRPMDSDTPPALAELVMGTLERRPENRPDQAEIAAALEPFVEAMPRKVVLSRLKPRMH